MKGRARTLEQEKAKIWELAQESYGKCKKLKLILLMTTYPGWAQS